MINLRHAQETDVPKLAAIGIAAWEKAVAGLADVNAMRRVAELSFLSFLGSNWLSVHVVDSDAQPVAWAAREQGDDQISDLWVMPGYQRAGVGSLLLDALEADIDRGGFDSANVTTHAQNAQAIGFFRKHGYAIRSLSTTYAAKLDRNVESVELIKILHLPAQASDERWL